MFNNKLKKMEIVKDTFTKNLYDINDTVKISGTKEIEHLNYYLDGKVLK